MVKSSLPIGYTTLKNRNRKLQVHRKATWLSEPDVVHFLTFTGPSIPVQGRELQHFALGRGGGGRGQKLAFYRDSALDLTQFNREIRTMSSALC